MKFKIWPLILFLLLVLPRLYRFGQIPESLYWDEVAIGLDARSIVQTGKDLSEKHWLQPLFYSYGDFKAPVYTWLTTVLGAFFGITEKIIRLSSLLVSFGLAFVLYQLTSLLFPERKKLPLFVAINLLIMPWSFHFSRIGMESYLSLFWLVLMVYLQVLGFKKQRPFLMIPAALAGSLSIYSYIGARVITIILYLATFLIFGFVLKKAKKQLINFGAGFLILVASMGILIKSPYYLASQDYRLSNDNLLTKTEHITQSVSAQEFHNRSFLSRLFHHRYLYWLHFYFQNYFAHFTPNFLLFEGDTNLRHHSGFGGEILLVQGILLIIGIFIITRVNRTATLILIWFLASPLVSSLVNNEVPHASRAIYMIVPLSLLLGLGMENIYQKLKKMRWGNLLFFGSVGFLAVNFAVFLHDYFIHYPARSKIAWLVPYKKAAEYFRANPPEKKVFITDKWYQPGLYFAFYGDVKTSNLQGSFENFLKKSNGFVFSLPETCPPDAWCLAPPNWQINETKVVSQIPGIEELMIKEKGQEI